MIIPNNLRRIILGKIKEIYYKPEFHQGQKRIIIISRSFPIPSHIAPQKCQLETEILPRVDLTISRVHHNPRMSIDKTSISLYSHI